MIYQQCSIRKIPFWIGFDDFKNCLFAKFEDEVKFSFPTKNLNQTNQIRMFQILGKGTKNCIVRSQTMSNLRKSIVTVRVGTQMPILSRILKVYPEGWSSKLASW